MNRVVLYLGMCLSIVHAGIANAQSTYSDKLAHTYSIVARDAETGEMGVAVQSHWFSVGSLVTWAEAGVGAIATQSFVNASFGPRGLALLKQGKSAQEVVDELIASDEGRAVRQLAIVDARGNVAAHTGDKCIPGAGHQTGDQYSAQANLMLTDTVWSEMARAYEAADGPLAERLITALEAAQSTGGDIRGKQSAAILVVKGAATGKPWEDRYIDLRVEDNAEPVQELKRLLRVFRAYEHMNNGDVAMEHNDIDGALREYGMAQAMFPENLEMKYWHAVSLANADQVDASLPMFKEVFGKDKNWVTLTERLPNVDLLSVSKADLDRILSQK